MFFTLRIIFIAISPLSFAVLPKRRGTFARNRPMGILFCNYTIFNGRKQGNPVRNLPRLHHGQTQARQGLSRDKNRWSRKRIFSCPVGRGRGVLTARRARLARPLCRLSAFYRRPVCISLRVPVSATKSRLSCFFNQK